MREKTKYLVRQKRYTAEKDTWKKLENSENIIELVKEFNQRRRDKKSINKKAEAVESRGRNIQEK